MKTFKRIIALIIAVVLMAGCTMKGEAGLVISSDGKVSTTVITAYDNEMIDGLLSMDSMGEEQETEKEYTEEERWAFVEKNKKGKEERYEKDGLKGLIVTEEIGTLDDISTTSATSRVNIVSSDKKEKDAEGANFEFKNKDLFIKDGKKYKSNMTVDLGEDAQKMEQYKSYGALFEVNFTITLPVKPTSNNATKVSEDGKTLTWDLLTTKDIEVEFELDETAAAKDSKEDKKSSTSTTGENSNLMLYVGIGAGVLVLLVIIIVVVVASSKKKKAQAAAAAQPSVMAPTYGPTVQPLEPPVQPVQPVQPEQPAQPVEPQDPNNNQQM